ncbi:helix-turn-helix transcriptional regulator [Rossellomorea sp. LjRoot5]|uniref:helix-turn-helix transcriptional regulator n=1 Tax=Rossellomorea sp. LjRoot5 TaxID=3342331 RepID=UPI003ECE9D35
MSNEKFRMVRLFLDMTQQEFARHLDIAYSTVYGIEAGNRRVSDKVAAKIAHKFEITDEFMAFADRVKRLEAI